MADVSNEAILNAILELKGDVGGLLSQTKAHGDAFAVHLKDDALLNARVAAINTTLSEKRGATRLAHAMYVGLGTVGGAVAGFLGRYHG